MERPPQRDLAGEVRELDRRLAGESDPAVMAGLLLRRGAALVLLARSDLAEAAARGRSAQAFQSYGSYFLQGLRDFESVLDRYPESPEAPEALYRLGWAYDAPPAGSRDVALDYYRRTMERFPGTPAAARAAERAAAIEKARRTHPPGPP